MGFWTAYLGLYGGGGNVYGTTLIIATPASGLLNSPSFAGGALDDVTVSGGNLNGPTFGGNIA